MRWEITTHEIELAEGEMEAFLIGDRERPLPASGELDHSALVLIEALSGAPESFEAFVLSDGAEFETGARSGSAQVFIGKVKKAAFLSVTLTARVWGRFRVSVLRLRDKLKQAWEEFPCDTCKSVAKILARSLLGWLGLGMPLDAGPVLEAIGEIDVGELFEKLRDSALWRWIADSGLEVLAVAVFGPLMLALRQAFKAEEWVYDEACRAVGACKGS